MMEREGKQGWGLPERKKSWKLGTHREDCQSGSIHGRALSGCLFPAAGG